MAYRAWRTEHSKLTTNCRQPLYTEKISNSLTVQGGKPFRFSELPETVIEPQGMNWPVNHSTLLPVFSPFDSIVNRIHS